MLEAGIKSALVQSGVYPYEFGTSIGALIPKREARYPRDHFCVDDYIGEDSLGSLDDLTKGRHRCWWRKL